MPSSRLVTLDWYRTFPPAGRRAFWAAFAGIGFAGFDLLSFTFVLRAIALDLGLSEERASFLATASLLSSAAGGVVAGVLADRIGRVRTLVLALTLYAVSTLLTGLAVDFWSLLIFRAALGLGVGGAFTAGMLLVAEYAAPAQRGRAQGVLISGYILGLLGAAGVYAVAADLVGPQAVWRPLFWVGVLPVLLVPWIRRTVHEPPLVLAADAAAQPAGGSWTRIFRGHLLTMTLAGTALAAGALGGSYVVIVWLPTFVQQGRDLSATATSALLWPVYLASWLGSVAAGYLNDGLGRRRANVIFAVASAAAILLYVATAAGPIPLVVLASLPLGFFTSGAVAGLGGYLAELYPTAVRGLGQGFTYSVGRAFAGLPVIAVGHLAPIEGLGRAIATGSLLYVLCLLALPFLPETRGRSLADHEPATPAAASAPAAQPVPPR